MSWLLALIFVMAQFAMQIGVILPVSSYRFPINPVNYLWSVDIHNGTFLQSNFVQISFSSGEKVLKVIFFILLQLQWQLQYDLYAFLIFFLHYSLCEFIIFYSQISSSYFSVTFK